MLEKLFNMENIQQSTENKDKGQAYTQMLSFVISVLQNPIKWVTVLSPLKIE